MHATHKTSRRRLSGDQLWALSARALDLSFAPPDVRSAVSSAHFTAAARAAFLAGAASAAGAAAGLGRDFAKIIVPIPEAASERDEGPSPQSRVLAECTADGERAAEPGPAPSEAGPARSTPWRASRRPPSLALEGGATIAICSAPSSPCPSAGGRPPARRPARSASHHDVRSADAGLRPRPPTRRVSWHDTVDGARPPPRPPPKDSQLCALEEAVAHALSLAEHKRTEMEQLDAAIEMTRAEIRAAVEAEPPTGGPRAAELYEELQARAPSPAASLSRPSALAALAALAACCAAVE